MHHMQRHKFVWKIDKSLLLEEGSIGRRQAILISLVLYSHARISPIVTSYCLLRRTPLSMCRPGYVRSQTETPFLGLITSDWIKT